MTKDQITDMIDTMDRDELESALQFLIGYNTHDAAVCVVFGKSGWDAINALCGDIGDH
jgi:hypothetical protein